MIGDSSPDIDVTRLKQRLQHFSPAPDDDPGFAAVLGRGYYQFELSRDEMPLPDVARMMLRLIGCKDLGRTEKLAWEVTFYFEGLQCSLALQKSGTRLYIARTAGTDEKAVIAAAKRIDTQLRKAQRVAEKEILAQISRDQVTNGNVTIQNQYWWLREVYMYFREGAQLAFDGKGRLGPRHPNGGYWLFPEQREGACNTLAMVWAYFSLLEHVLVLCLPFIGFDPSKQSITNFIGKRWSDKFRYIFDIAADLNAKKLYDLLHTVSETYRNTYGHGGFGKDDATIYFHVAGVGALPTVLSKISKSPQFELVPVKQIDYREACRLFDKVDSWFDKAITANAMLWIKAGLDVRYDSVFRADLALAEQEDFTEFLDYSVSKFEQTINMDW